MDNYLILESKNYKGQYVTMCGPDSKKIISASTSPEVAFKEAQASGCEHPVLLYVPKEDDSTFIY